MQRRERDNKANYSQVSFVERDRDYLKRRLKAIENECRDAKRELEQACEQKKRYQSHLDKMVSVLDNTYQCDNSGCAADFPCYFEGSSSSRLGVENSTRYVLRCSKCGRRNGL